MQSLTDLVEFGGQFVYPAPKFVAFIAGMNKVVSLRQSPKKRLRRLTMKLRQGRIVSESVHGADTGWIVVGWHVVTIAAQVSARNILCKRVSWRTTNNVTKTPDLIGSAEACELLGIDRATISRWVAAGRLTPAIELPGRTGTRLFKRADIQALVTEREQAS